MNDHIEDIIEKNGFFACTTVGMSMFPMLRNRKDVIVIKPIKGRLHKYDIPLYKRDHDYVLHRVVKVLDDCYIIIGDNCISKEKVFDNQIIGILDCFYRNGKQIKLNCLGYKLYSKIWVALYPIRIILMRLKHWCGNIKRKVYK